MDKKNELYKYRYVLLAATAGVNVVGWGALYNIGLFYVQWVAYFDSTKADAALVGGLSTGTACAFGPLFGAVIHRFGFRRTGMVGGLLMASSYIASAFAPNLVYLGFFYGILSGVGTGLCHLAASVALNQYFFKERSLAEGITASGVGIGTFLMAIFTQYLINQYDWRGAMAITGAVTAHLIVFCQLMISPSDLKKFPRMRHWKSNEKTQKVIRLSLQPVENSLCEKLDMKDDKMVLNNRKSSYEIEISTESLKYDDMVKKNRKSWFAQCLQLFRNPVFILLLTADFLCWLCIYVPYVHMAERSRLQGVDVDTVAWISSMVGITGIVGRPLISAIPTLLNVNVFYVYGFTNALLGFFTVLSPWFATRTGLFVYAALFGFLSVCVPLGKTSAAHLLGNKCFPLAYSWMLLFEGIGVYVGPPLAGWICDITLSYDSSFYSMGAGLILSGSLVVFKNVAIGMENRLRAERKHRKQEIKENERNLVTDL